VLDPFVGSGTTAISCIMNNRKYIGFDINSKYIKDSRRRIQQCLRIKK
jgi:site-specific DNA-methyltransferase (adenine-specific)